MREGGPSSKEHHTHIQIMHGSWVLPLQLDLDFCPMWYFSYHDEKTVQFSQRRMKRGNNRRTHLQQRSQSPHRRPPLRIFSLILFQFFIYASPIYALVRVGTDARLERSPKNCIQREIRTTKHHLAHVIQTVSTQLAILRRWKRLGLDDHVTPDYIEAAQLVE